MVAINGMEIVGRAFLLDQLQLGSGGVDPRAMWVYFFAYALIAKNEEYIRVDFAAKSDAARLAVHGRYFRPAGHDPVSRHGRLVRGRDLSFLGLFTTSVLIWPESLFVLPILIGAIDILITELIYLYWVLTRRLSAGASRCAGWSGVTHGDGRHDRRPACPDAAARAGLRRDGAVGDRRADDARHAVQHVGPLHGDRRAVRAVAGDSVLRPCRQHDEPVRHDAAHLQFPRSGRRLFLGRARAGRGAGRDGVRRHLGFGTRHDRGPWHHHGPCDADGRLPAGVRRRAGGGGVADGSADPAFDHVHHLCGADERLGRGPVHRRRHSGHPARRSPDGEQRHPGEVRRSSSPRRRSRHRSSGSRPRSCRAFRRCSRRSSSCAA